MIFFSSFLLFFFFHVFLVFLFLIRLITFFFSFSSMFLHFSFFLVFLSRRGGFGPSSGLVVLFAADVGPSFSSLGFALPVGLALPSLGVAVGPSGWGWLARPRPKRGEGQAQPERGEWEGQGPSKKERKGRALTGRVRPDQTPKIEDVTAHDCIYSKKSIHILKMPFPPLGWLALPSLG